MLQEILEADEIACAANTLAVKNDTFMWEAETGLDQHGVPVPINTATSWIDGSGIYGGTPEKEAFQREFKGFLKYKFKNKFLIYYKTRIINNSKFS